MAVEGQDWAGRVELWGISGGRAAGKQEGIWRKNSYKIVENLEVTGTPISPPRVMLTSQCLGPGTKIQMEPPWGTVSLPDSEA